LFFSQRIVVVVFLRDFTQLLTKNYDDGIVIVVRVQFLGLQSRRAEWFLAEIKKKSRAGVGIGQI